MTTAFVLAARGRLVASFHAQPAGFCAALAVMLIGALALTTLVAGKVWFVNWCILHPTRVVTGVAAILALGWAYKLATFALSR